MRQVSSCHFNAQNFAGAPALRAGDLGVNRGVSRMHLIDLRSRAAVCKVVDAGSIPTPASIRLYEKPRLKKGSHRLFTSNNSRNCLPPAKASHGEKPAHRPRNQERETEG